LRDTRPVKNYAKQSEKVLIWEIQPYPEYTEPIRIKNKEITKVAALVNSAKEFMFSLCFARIRKNYYYKFSQNCRKGGWEGWVCFVCGGG